ncbi:MAG: hypothetical protein IKU30_06730 [Clostridia bacterium]|nr:hypothetical protein [Clostridia bacterium]
MKNIAINFGKRVAAALFVVILLSITIVSTACSSNDDSSNTLSSNDESDKYSNLVEEDVIDFSAFKILSSKYASSKIEVETTLCKISYSAAFSDVISVKPEGLNNCAKLNFYANLSSGETLIYSIIFGGEESTAFGKLQVNEGKETINVYVSFYDAPANLDKDDKATFNATQETFNDVVSSLNDDPRFSEIR